MDRLPPASYSQSTRSRTLRRGATTGPYWKKTTAGRCWISTPRGRNHLLQLYQHATRTRGWFSEILTVDDTAALSPEALAEALSEYQSLYGEDAGSAMFEQEMMCSFNAALLGTFYGREMRDVRNEGRILRVSRRSTIAGAHVLGISASATTRRSGGFRAQGAQLVLLDHYAAIRRRPRALPRADREAREAARLDARQRLRPARCQGEGVGQWTNAS